LNGSHLRPPHASAISDQSREYHPRTSSDLDTAGGTSGGVAPRHIPDRNPDSRTLGFYAAIARRIWPDDHIALHQLHTLEVKAIDLGRERTSTFLKKAEVARIAAELAAAGVAG